jgi:hypothetical protein
MVERILSNQSTPSVCLWKENPNRLVRLWDMLRIHAMNFVRVGSQTARCITNTGAVEFPDAEADESILKQFSEIIETLEYDREDLGLEHTPEIVGHHKKIFERGGMTYAQVRLACQEIQRIYQSEVRGRLFLYVTNERKATYDVDRLFGSEVDEAFPSAAAEIRDAGSCLALEQETACVMHLMRALETPIVLLADKFSVPSSRENWNKILERIQKEVNDLGPSLGADWKEHKEWYSEACAYFLHFKNAWRNHAMHGRTRYNGTEAKRIMDHTKGFMEHLAKRLREVP